ncbi:MAG: hypothetical protein ABSC19_10860 [Syntrophorhabdales bacterium]|jgi:hypothetical protein
MTLYCGIDVHAKNSYLATAVPDARRRRALLVAIPAVPSRHTELAKPRKPHIKAENLSDGKRTPEY